MNKLSLLAFALVAATVMPSCVVPVGPPPPPRSPHSPLSPGGRYVTPAERHRLRHAHPSPGYRPVHRDIVVLPSGARRVVYHGGTYYRHGAVWYRPSGGGYIVTPRPY